MKRFMKNMIYVLPLLFFSATSLFAAEFEYADFQRILDQKCTQCHTRQRIDEAIRQGNDREAIISKMIHFGARLSEQEQKVMGVFWTAPKEPKPVLGRTEDPLRQYRTVLQQRCTGCHSLEIVEKAMAQGRSIDQLVEEMRRRGAIITPADKSVLGTFWGNPLKETPE